MNLYMILLGCKPDGRLTEQHDIFFGIAENLKALVPDIEAFWPSSRNKIHIDAWREVRHVDGYKISVVSRTASHTPQKPQLFFLNLGGYIPNEFEEIHHKVLAVANSLEEAKLASKKSIFFKKQAQYKNQLATIAVPHIDDKYGIDVDDAYTVEDILSKKFTDQFSIIIEFDQNATEDEIHLGYHRINKL